jgi:large subunit ribosomal protein L21
MKKAVIATGGKQYIVSEGETLAVELLGTDSKTVTFEPLLIIDGATTEVGTPMLSARKVTAKVLEPIKGDKVLAIRYKAKKRVHTVKGHRQNFSQIQITKIA